MRHRKAGVKLNRNSSHRKAMFRNMVTSLLKHDRIKTTDTRAKEVSRWADHIITLAKIGDLHARRQAMAIVREKDVVHKIFEEAKERFGQRNGGYTRVIKLGRRPGDAALISMIELVSADDPVKKKKKKTKAASKKSEAPKQEAVKAAPAASADERAPEAEVQAAVVEEAVEPDTAGPGEEAAGDVLETAPEQQEATAAEADTVDEQHVAAGQDAEEVEKKSE
jgi:large subunit ribosomal protein L17